MNANKPSGCDNLLVDISVTMVQVSGERRQLKALFNIRECGHWHRVGASLEQTSVAAIIRVLIEAPLLNHAAGGRTTSSRGKCRQCVF